jgi:glycosyltransferase involved in cell wall biosynthesis
MHATLIVPAPFDTVSGGYAYDRRIVAGLRAEGHTIGIRELTGGDAALALASLPAATIPVIDGLALPAFAACAEALAQREAVALIHHPTAFETGLEDARRADIERRLLGCFARIIATSGATADHLAAAFAVARERIAVVVPGTDDAPRAVGSGGPTCNVLSLGALVPRKGHDLLLRALARLFDLDWHLTIVGTATRDAAYAHGLQALAEELRIAPRITFAGEVDDAALDALWHRTDLFALATHWEGYGMAIAEAFKRGIPVVVTQGGAAGSLVTLESGVVCPVGDQNQLSKSLRRMIFGAALRRDMAEAAWRVGQTLPDWPTQAHAFANALAFAHAP